MFSQSRRETSGCLEALAHKSVVLDILGIQLRQLRANLGLVHTAEDSQ